MLGHEVTVDVEGARDPREYDLVHLFNFATPKLTQTLAQRAKAAGVPFVVTSLYEDIPEFHNQSHALASALIEYVCVGQKRENWPRYRSAAAGVAPAQRFQCDWLMEHADAVLANGAGEARALRRDFPLSVNVVEVPVGHETGAAGDAALFEQTFGVRDFVLCVGRLESRKNQLMLLKALEDSELPVVLAAGGFSYQPEYEHCVRSFKRRGKTLVLDRLSPEMLAAAYAACRIHVLPSWYELPGLVSLEAASFGKNIVITRTGTSADYMGDVAFFCSPADEDSIFSAVTAAYHSPARPKLVETARAYTWERSVKETVRVYRAVVARRIQDSAEQPIFAPDAHEASASAVPAGAYDMSFNAMEFEDCLEQGEAAAKALDFGRAEELLRRADSIDSGSARAAKSLAAVLLAQSRAGEARELFEKALRLSPADPKTLAGRGMCETMSGKPEAALPFLEKALDIAPDTLVALYQMIECAYRLDRYDRAETAIRRYLSAVPSDTEIRFCLAGCLYKSGQLAACESEVSRVLAEKPQHEGGQELRVRVQAELAAQQASQAQREQDPKQAAPLLSPEGLEELSQRIQAWTVGSTSPTAVDVAPDTKPSATAKPTGADISAIIADLESLKRAGKVTEAKEILAGIPTGAGSSAEQRELLGCLRAEFYVLDGNLAEASATYDLLLDQNPHLARALCGKGALAAESQDWATAQAFFETSLDYNASYDVALAGLGLCRMVQDQPEEAFALFTQAATLNPENHRALLGVLQLGYPLKRYAEMERLITSYLRRYPANLDMIYSFAGLLYAQGRVNEARMQVEKILVVEPKHEPALELREILDKVDAGPEFVM